MTEMTPDDVPYGEESNAEAMEDEQREEMERQIDL